jgi:hypothetical protein
VTSPGYNLEIPITISQGENLIFSAKEVKKFHCQFEAPQPNDSPELQISTISLYLGSEKRCCVILRFSASGRESNLLDRMYPEIQQLRYTDDFYEIVMNFYFKSIK